MTGPEHYLEAERLGRQADSWENADTGWKAHLTAEERLTRRANDLAAAQLHATLALAAATAMGALDAADINTTDLDAWCEVSGTRRVEPVQYEDEPSIDDVRSASERYEMDRDAEYAHDAAADVLAAEAGDVR